ncbi:hypothetical protein CIB93_04475 [Streptomyces sp. WZ.A104]|uniref:hypothetical protein n=1 Tax=Streptomyces sp. WZ.A104 TaxID=2023771 RepID=UPI000BBB797C|nr:hypothetical protein [Streptomyces sp. WZ.A104]PCG87108.1 hypothetical protein CIB93_04475 [Streptomyces sp. WZ.A104]
MRTEEARKAIAAWVTQQISAGFRLDVEELNEGRGAHRRSRPGRLHPAYDATRAPEVPPAVVRTRQVPAGERTAVIFTWKVESGAPPYFIIDIPTYWPRRIAAPGWVIVADRPVVDVLAWDAQRRPATIKTVSLHSFFDSSIHGWRSWASNVEYDIDWSDPEVPALRDPAPEPAARP